MRNSAVRSLSFLLIVGLIVAIILGCAATKPNNPSGGPYPQSFNGLSAKNALLANELGKLPEIQDGMSAEEIEAIELFAHIYFDNSSRFDSMFSQMYDVGKPEIRKYNTPLQAYFWLLLDGKSVQASQFLVEYRLVDLLKASWMSANREHITYWNWRLKENEKVKTSCTDQDLIAKIIEFNEENPHPNDYSIQLSKDHPEHFNYHFDETKYETYIFIHRERWKNFDLVTDRLNSPELIDHYQKTNFVYDLDSSSKAQTARSMFKRKWGNCDAYSDFAVYCLSKAGYKARKIFVHQLPSGWWYHLTTVYKDEDGWYVLDNAWKDRVGGIKGPFKSISEVRKFYS